LKKLATKKAKEQLEQREPKLPSPTFISSYLGAFRPRKLSAHRLKAHIFCASTNHPDPKPTLPATPTQGDQTLMLAFDALSAADYSHAVSFVNEAIDQGVSWKEGQAEAYNLRATFK
jgi:import receptor subunit TOM70